MRYRLRTLLILMAVAPPLLAAAWLLRVRVRQADYTNTARAQVSILHDAIQFYLLGVGDLPPDLNALVVLPPIPNPQNWSGPYIEWPQLPVDPWTHPYVYEPDRAASTFRISSKGPDGLPQTDDDIAMELE